MIAQERTGFTRALLVVGSIGPLGHLPASGTVTVALVGIPLFYLMHTLSPLAYALVTCLVTAAAWVIHHLGDRALGRKDSSTLVWDELVGYMIAVALLPAFTWRLALAAFLIERVIDIAKVPPAHWVERRLPGGWGVVGDDVIAGFYTLGIMHGLVALVPRVMGV